MRGDERTARASDIDLRQNSVLVLLEGGTFPVHSRYEWKLLGPPIGRDKPINQRGAELAPPDLLELTETIRSIQPIALQRAGRLLSAFHCQPHTHPLFVPCNDKVLYATGSIWPPPTG